MSFPDGIHPNLKKLSESSQRLLHSCPRRYQLYRLMSTITKEEGDEHLAFGSAVGAGSQSLLIDSNDMDKAIWEAFINYRADIDDDFGMRIKKTFWHAIMSLEKFYEFRHAALRDWDVLIYNDKPAVELGYSIDCGYGFYHRGLLDALLVNKRSGHLMVYEGKTTTYNKVHEAAYKNSGQALGYSVIVDTIAKQLGIPMEAENYEVFYGVYKSSSQEWEDFRFAKNNSQRAMWIRQLLRDIQHISEFAQDGYFPRYGESCYSFFRPCPYLDVCNMRDESLMIAPIEKVPVNEDDPEKYPFRFTLDELIQTQLEKHG